MLPLVSANSCHKRQCWFFFDTGAGSPGFNMAFDEALLLWIPKLGSVLFRVYGWTEPTVSFGYFQNYRVAEAIADGRPIVRRPTGGGIVFHGADWTYAIAIPTHHWWYRLKAIESYRVLHEWIAAAFAKLGLPTTLALQKHKPLDVGQCFVGHEQYDLLFEGQKIAGAAQRRTRSGLLIQGSVLPPEARLELAEWVRAMKETAETVFKVEWTSWVPPAELISQATQLAVEKFNTLEFIRRR